MNIFTVQAKSESRRLIAMEPFEIGVDEFDGRLCTAEVDILMAG